MNEPKKTPTAYNVNAMVRRACEEQGIPAGQAAKIAKRVETLFQLGDNPSGRVGDDDAAERR
jgi:hypothetical protein